MGIAKKGFAIVTLAAAACQPAPAPEIGIAGATPIAYDAIRQGSGVLGYAESLLGPDLATKYDVAVGPGASAVEAKAVAGAWELPAGTRPEAVAEALRARGTLGRAREREDGQIWIADWRPNRGAPVRLLLIDGTSPAFERRAAPEVRPGPHVYLIAYRIP
jgi:hypothetical protein